MRVLLDMNLSPRWVGAFENAGIEAAHWSTLGPGNATDREILAYAKTQGYVVLTHDLDFSAILAASQGEGPSVVQIRSDDPSPDKLSSVVVNALRQMAAELDAGALMTIDPGRTRLRLLPLKPAE